MNTPRMQRAVISVSDKSGLVDFVCGLTAAGVEIFSTGGTRKHLEDAGLAVKDISAYTGFPEMMDGRLKTLHPKVFGGILCRRDREDDMASIGAQGIVPFELVVVNLYPFEATVAKPHVTVDEAIENIDIGGPSLVRAAAKNHAFVTIATSANQYAEILAEVSQQGGTSLALRRRLMAEAFAHTAAYDCGIADFFGKQWQPNDFPPALNVSLKQVAELRYGENPHQRAALYGVASERGANLVQAKQLNGKELSYNNLLDLDSALAIVRSFNEPAVSVIKHNNPCGAAAASRLVEAAKLAMAGDPTSAFGSVLGCNRPVDAATAELLSEPGLFIEAIVAPTFEPAALEILTTKPKWKANVRLMAVGALTPPGKRELRPIHGGMLVQDANIDPDPESEWKVVTQKQPTDEQLADLRFGWSIVRHVKSNAIVLCRGKALWGAGAGQMSRVDSVDISIHKAGEKARGAVLASDAFFPFPDSIQKAAAAGVAAVIQPGGSKNDEQVIAACNEFGIPMIFTGRRHFKH